MNAAAKVGTTKSPGMSPVLIAIVAGGFAVLQVTQVIYRSYLFLAEYHSQPNVNHIGNGDFALIYIANAVVFAFSLWSYRSSASTGNRFSRLMQLVILANVVCCFALFVMHRTGVLVEYHEFIRAMKAS